jgi:flavin-dependent dehydrogenase
MEQKEINKDYDIIIVGGGPSGVSTWLHLQKFDPELAKRTLLIEKESYPRDKLCGGALGGWSEYVLNDLQIKMEIPFVKIQTLECRYGNQIYRQNFENIFRIIRRFDFDATFAKAAIKRGLTLRENESFLNFERTKDDIIVSTSKKKYKAKFLIGADGALSKVRRKMKLPLKTNLGIGLEIFAKANPQIDLEHAQNKAILDFSPVSEGLQGYVWHFPCIENDVPSMNHGLVDFRIFSKKSGSDIKKIFIKELKNRKIQADSKLWRSHPIPWITQNNIISQPNILLVGDAAGIDPAIGGGIHLAFSYGELAASTIVDSFKREDFKLYDFPKRMNSHIVGKYIFKLNKLAEIMYSKPEYILKITKEIFDKK